MSDTDGKKPLGLRGSRPGNVKQSFSHGRTKNVVVETKRKRVVVPKPGGAAQGTAATGVVRGDPSKRPAGISEAELARRMRAVHGEVVFDEFADELSLLAGPRLLRAPKQTVVDDEQIRLRRGSHSHGGEGGVDGGGDARNGAVVFHLQPVHRAVVILDGIDAQSAVAVFYDFFQQRLWHAP